MNSGRTRSHKVSQQYDYVALRNRSLSGDKGTANWLHTLNEEVEEDYAN
jgi:hypothetical protein